MADGVIGHGLPTEKDIRAHPRIRTGCLPRLSPGPGSSESRRNVISRPESSSGTVQGEPVFSFFGGLMQKFQNEDQVRIIEGAHLGQTGIVYGHPFKMSAPEVGGRAFGVDDYLYRVDLDGTSGTVTVTEADLAAI